MHEYTFLTGAPGSRWSGVGQIIAENFGYNTSDETDWRLYKHGEFQDTRVHIGDQVWNLVMSFID